MNTGKIDGILIEFSKGWPLPIEQDDITTVCSMMAWGYAFSDVYFAYSLRTVRDLMLAGF